MKNENSFDYSLSRYQRFIKRCFDLFFSFSGLLILFFPMLVMVVLATLFNRSFWAVQAGKGGAVW
ncbi:MAG: hypothetical protein U5K51_13985 [Flavobacteriaceae bacterium]|nr:hypothetical protein [Flavobacteriaceae bacterium]